MSKNLKKVMVAGASLLMLASVGAGTSQAVQPAHAASEHTEMTELQHMIGHLNYNHDNSANKYYRGHKYSFYGVSVKVDGHRVTLAQALKIAKRSHKNKQIAKKHSRRLAKSAWHAGMPYPLSKKGYWISNFMHDTWSPKYRYVKYTMPLAKHTGFSITAHEYNVRHHQTNIGSGSGNDGDNPYYKSLGHGWYRIASDSIAKHHALRNDLRKGNVTLIHVRDSNHFSIYNYYKMFNKRHVNVINFHRDMHWSKAVKDVMDFTK